MPVHGLAFYLRSVQMQLLAASKKWSMHYSASNKLLQCCLDWFSKLDEAAFIPTGLGTALAAQAAEQHDKEQKLVRAQETADARRKQVLVSACKLHSSFTPRMHAIFPAL